MGALPNRRLRQASPASPCPWALCPPHLQLLRWSISCWVHLISILGCSCCTCLLHPEALQTHLNVQWGQAAHRLPFASHAPCTSLVHARSCSPMPADA